jgi:hypothetical protein
MEENLPERQETAPQIVVSQYILCLEMQAHTTMAVAIK